ncbi:plasmid mobilization protein, partial [Flexibacterium corallicola]|uniref:plasmid mobilization protein n=1 Tax=Flexibacterium corallicola TaxID=3037259 RepID=UPI00286EB980
MSERRQTTKQTNLRWTPEQFAVLSEHAAAAGMTPGEFAKRDILQRLDQPIPPRRTARSAVAKAVAAWTGAVGKIGNNLNQLAAIANGGGAVDGRAVAELRADVRQLHADVISSANGELEDVG